MNKTSKLMLPVAVAAAGFLGVGGASLLNSLSANAASNTTGSSSTNSSTGTAPPSGTPQGPHVANGITETVLTGDTYTQAVAAAQTAEPGATVVRAETDADGAKYEVHMKKPDGSLVTVKLDASFNVTSTEDGMGAGGPGSGSSSTSSN